MFDVCRENGERVWVSEEEREEASYEEYRAERDEREERDEEGECECEKEE